MSGPDMEVAAIGAGHEPEPIPGKCNGRIRDKARRGALCRLTAGQGTDHVGFGRCSRHGGSTPSHVAAAGKAIASQAVATYGLPIDIDPRDALLLEVQRTAGHVAWLAQVVQGLTPEELVWGKTEEVDTQASEYPGTNTKRAAVPNAYLQLYLAERKHLVDVSKAAITAGIEERRVRVAEAMGAQIVALIRSFAGRLSLTAVQLELVPAALTAAMAEIGATPQ
jgi:hypothetical protein